MASAEPVGGPVTAEARMYRAELRGDEAAWCEFKDLHLSVEQGIPTVMLKAFGPETPVLETEAMIRHTLGDEDVQVGDIDLRPEILGKVLTVIAVTDVLELGEAAVNAIAVEAEALARQRGFQPSLASAE